MKIADRLIPATFVKRDNRFRVTVRLEGHLVWAHLPNSGRLRELLVPGRRVLLAAAQTPGRLTAYDLLMVDLDGTLVSIDARMPSRLLYETLRQSFDKLRIPAQDKALQTGQLGEFAGYAEVGAYSPGLQRYSPNILPREDVFLCLVSYNDDGAQALRWH